MIHNGQIANFPSTNKFQIRITKTKNKTFPNFTKRIIKCAIKQYKSHQISFPQTNRQMSLKLRSLDDDIFKIDPKVAKMSETIANMMKSPTQPDGIIPLNISSPILQMIIKWMTHHQNDPPLPDEVDYHLEEVPAWDQEFLGAMEQGPFFELFLAAEYLNIRALLHICAKSVADIMRGKSPEVIRAIFSIDNDLDEAQPSQVVTKPKIIPIATADKANSSSVPTSGSQMMMAKQQHNPSTLDVIPSNTNDPKARPDT